MRSWFDREIEWTFKYLLMKTGVIREGLPVSRGFVEWMLNVNLENRIKH